MLIIKNFQPQRNRPIATYLNVTDLAQVVERASRELGSKEKLKARLNGLMAHHGLVAHEHDVRSFVDSVGAYSVSQRPLKAFKVFWHSMPVATLSHDGHIWSFDYERSVGLQLSVAERRGKRSPPSFLGSILSEMGPSGDGSLEDKLDAFRLGSRYISNITVHPTGNSNSEVIPDVISGELSKFMSDQMVFSGRLDGRLSSSAADEALLNDMQEHPAMPRISGMQVKLAVHLDQRGQLSAAFEKAFTHILKIPGGGASFQSLGSMEWFSLTVAKLCGLNTEQFAVVPLPGRGPALVVERFDVRRDLNDTRLILTEDFWSVAGMTENKQKYTGELMDVASALAKHSTEPGLDGRRLVGQAIFSWLTWNGDMHLKNLMLLKESRDPRKGFDSVRLSPIYDILCTQVYPNDAKSSAIGLCGSRNHTLAGFRSLGKKFGIPSHETDSLADFMSTSILMWARRVSSNLPPVVAAHDQSVRHIERAVSLFEVRCMMMLKELEESKGLVNRRVDVDNEDEESFTAEDLGAISDHVAAERRRSWSSSASQSPSAMMARVRP